MVDSARKKHPVVDLEIEVPGLKENQQKHS